MTDNHALYTDLHFWTDPDGVRHDQRGCEQGLSLARWCPVCGDRVCPCASGPDSCDDCYLAHSARDNELRGLVELIARQLVFLPSSGATQAVLSDCSALEALVHHPEHRVECRRGLGFLLLDLGLLMPHARA